MSLFFWVVTAAMGSDEADIGDNDTEDLHFESWMSQRSSIRNQIPAYIRDEGAARMRDRWLVAVDDSRPLTGDAFARRLGDTERASALQRNRETTKRWTTAVLATSLPSIGFTMASSLSPDGFNPTFAIPGLVLAGAGVIACVPLIGALAERPKLAYTRDEAEHLIDAPPTGDSDVAISNGNR